jgi:hypothetical protein
VFLHAHFRTVHEHWLSLFDVFLQEVTVDRLGEVFTSSIRAENGRLVANSCDGTLNGWQKFVLGFVKLYAHEP